MVWKNGMEDNKPNKSNSKPSRKIRVAILFGGKSAEHEVSIQSAKNVLEALDIDKFAPVLIRIDKQGVWHTGPDFETLNKLSLLSNTAGSRLTLVPGNSSKALIDIAQQSSQNIDVAFPVLHGPMGEDGTVQGFLELAGIPYVGPGVLGSAVGMDKDVMKRLLRDAGIPIARHITVTSAERASVDTARIIVDLGLPLFVKPANMGSSVGVSKVEDSATLQQAIDLAFTFDRKILIEGAVEGDEIECSVLGNDHPKVSLPGRIIPQAKFYSYDAKYIDADGALLEIPAKLPAETIAKVQQIALKTFQTLCCEGMARVDMFLTKDGEVLVNEINTIPGFTKISMYPKLWEASGVPYKDLITRLLELAIERFEARQKLLTSTL
jgi:D-alanine-D-alanine ligase